MARLKLGSVRSAPQTFADRGYWLRFGSHLRFSTCGHAGWAWSQPGDLRRLAGDELLNIQLSQIFRPELFHGDGLLPTSLNSRREAANAFW